MSETPPHRPSGWRDSSDEERLHALSRLPADDQGDTPEETQQFLTTEAALLTDQLRWMSARAQRLDLLQALVQVVVVLAVGGTFALSSLRGDGLNSGLSAFLVTTLGLQAALFGLYLTRIRQRRNIDAMSSLAQALTAYSRYARPTGTSSSTSPENETGGKSD